MTLPEHAARHGFAVFQDRLIHEAQPPITPAQLAAIEAQIGAAVPPGLRALWETSFGGRVGYDLEVEFGDHVAGFSFSEIFYPGADTYRDLPGWIEHELELAEEDGKGGPLRFLPFGGFEYLDRLYVGLEAPHAGAVFAWMQGLPSAWALRLHEDSVARIADDVPALFRQLSLSHDPFTADDPYGAAHEVVDAIADVEPSDPVLAEALGATLRRAVLDWRGALEAGRLAGAPRLRRLALQQVAASGDLALAERMAAQGCDLGERYAGGGNLVDLLLVHGHDAQAGALIERGVDASQAIINAARSIKPERMRQLIAMGAEVTVLAAAQAALNGDIESAFAMADALDADQRAELSASLADSLEGIERSLKRVESGEMGSSMNPAQYREQIASGRRVMDYVAKHPDR